MPTPIYILAGQSNAVKLNGGVGGTNLQSYLEAMHGPGGAIGQTVAVGGSALTAAGSGQDWSSPDELQATLLSTIRAALTATPGSYFAGVMWVQGEADTFANAAASQYAARLNALVQMLDSGLADFGARASDFAFVVMALSGSAPAGADRANWDAIRAAQLGMRGDHIGVIDPDAVAASNGVPPDSMFGPDGLHYRYTMSDMLLDALVAPVPLHRAGGVGSDTLSGLSGRDRLAGNAGDDLLIGNGGRDVMFGGAGNDRLVTNGDGDGVYGGEGIDTLIFAGTAGRVLNLLEGTTTARLYFSGIENLAGGGGNDTLSGDAAANQLQGGAGNDQLAGFAGNDMLFGGVGRDILYGNTGSDQIFGGVGNDMLSGADQNDTLTGDAGNDLLRGGTGVDILTGGAGNDTFAFATTADISAGADVITDFSTSLNNHDHFLLAPGFGHGLATGTIQARHFQTRADNLAQDADDRFIFRTADKTLWFDANGNMAGGLVLLADLQASAWMTAADIMIG